MERVLEIVRMEDYCPSCHSKFSIELYDVYNNPLGLTRMLNRNIVLKSIENERLSYMKCKKCNKVYKIQYHNNIPRPLDESIDIEYNDFNNNLIKNRGVLYGRRF